MNELYDKSELNFDASQLLYNNNLYDCVCHPAYYSCLQLMSHKLIMKKIDLSTQAALTSRDYQGHSHQYLINETRKLMKFDKFTDERRYKSFIKQLKEFRERADYKEEKITQEESLQCISMAKEVRQQLKSI